jgi:hypothetical protein
MNESVLSGEEQDEEGISYVRQISNLLSGPDKR